MTIHEHNARERKALRISDHVWSCFLFAVGNTNPSHAQVSALVTELAASGEGVRAAFGRGAGTKPPSARTWLRVIELVSTRGMRACREAVMQGNGINGRMETMATVYEADQRARAAEADPFAGLTEADQPAY